MQLNLRSGNVIIKTFKTGIPLRSGHIVKRTKFTPRSYIKKNTGIHLRSGRLVKRSKITPRPYNRKSQPSVSEEEEEEASAPSITISIVPIHPTRTIHLRSRSVNLNLGKRTPRPYNKKQKQPQNSHVESMKDYYKNHFLATYLNLRYQKDTEEEAITKIRDWQAQEQRYNEWQAKHNPKNYLLDDY